MPSASVNGITLVEPLCMNLSDYSKSFISNIYENHGNHSLYFATDARLQLKCIEIIYDFIYKSVCYVKSSSVSLN